MQGNVSHNLEIMQECMKCPQSISNLKPVKAQFLTGLFIDLVKDVIQKLRERSEENLSEAFTPEEIEVFRNIELYVQKRPKNIQPILND